MVLWGVIRALLGSVGVRESLGRGGEVPGRFWGASGEAFGIVHLFFRGEFVSCPTKYSCFHLGVVL